MLTVVQLYKALGGGWETRGTLIIVGTIAIIYDVAATMLSVLFFGWLLIVAGVFEAVQSFWQPKWGGFFLHLIGGILALVVGFHLVTSPAAGALVLTLVMAIYFLVMGIVRAITALTMRFPSWGWVFLSGVVSFILGVLIKQQWPYSGLFIIGLFIGIDLTLQRLVLYNAGLGSQKIACPVFLPSRRNKLRLRSKAEKWQFRGRNLDDFRGTALLHRDAGCP